MFGFHNCERFMWKFCSLFDQFFFNLRHCWNSQCFCCTQKRATFFLKQFIYKCNTQNFFHTYMKSRQRKPVYYFISCIFKKDFADPSVDFSLEDSFKMSHFCLSPHLLVCNLWQRQVKPEQKVQCSRFVQILPIQPVMRHQKLKLWFAEKRASQNLFMICFSRRVCQSTARLG